MRLLHTIHIIFIIIKLLTPPVILEETTPIMTEVDGRIKVVNQNNFVFICIARDPSLYGGKWIQAMAAD